MLRDTTVKNKINQLEFAEIDQKGMIEISRQCAFKDNLLSLIGTKTDSIFKQCAKLVCGSSCRDVSPKETNLLKKNGKVRIMYTKCYYMFSFDILDDYAKLMPLFNRQSYFTKSGTYIPGNRNPIQQKIPSNTPAEGFVYILVDELSKSRVLPLKKRPRVCELDSPEVKKRKI